MLGMIILMGQRIGYVPMRKVIAMERSDPGMITASTTNQKTYNNELNYTINFQLYHLTKDDYVKISVSPIFYTFTILFLLE